MECGGKLIIQNLFEGTVKQFPNNIAISSDSGELSYKKLNAHANRIAHILRGLDISKHSIVGIYSDSSAEYVTAVLGVLKAGAIFIPLNPNFPEKYLALILEKAKPAVVITDTVLEKKFLENIHKLNLHSHPKELISLDEDCNVRVMNLSTGIPKDLSHGVFDENPALSSDPNDGCYIVTTSGTAGEPKAILGCQKGLSHFMQWEISEFNLNERIRVSMLSPVTFDVSLRDIFVPLLTGGVLCIPDQETRYEPKKLLRWMEDVSISVTHIVPTLFRLLTREAMEATHNESLLPHLSLMLIAGEVLYGNDVNNWRKAVGNHIKLINVYGPSETTLAKLFYPIKDEEIAANEIVPIGKPIPDTEVLIIKDKKLCSVNEIGEIYIKTPFMSKGYYNDPALNKSSFIQNPLVTDHQEITYKTGDLGKYMLDGNVQFAGRLDTQIKLYGKRIEIGEVEIALSRHPQVRESAIALKSDLFGNDRLVGYVVPKSGERIKVESLRRFLLDSLPDYMVPSIFVQLKLMPLTHSNKIDRRALPEPDHERPEMQQVYISPTTPIERILAEIWCQVLGIDRVGINDNFFDLGGTSILAAKVLVLLEQRLQTKLSIVTLFQYPNINSLAKYLNKSRSDDSSQTQIQERAQLRKSALSQQKRLKAKK